MIKSGVEASYFLDEMSLEETGLFIEAIIEEEDKDLDKLRTLGYWILTPWSKDLKPQDIFKIDSIDNKQTNNNKEVDKDRLMKFANRFKQDLEEKSWKKVKPNELH